MAITSQAATKPGKVTGLEGYTTARNVYTCAVWNKKKGVTGYQVQYGKISGYKTKWTSKRYKVKGYKKHNHKIKTNGWKYGRVRVRAYKVKNGKTLYGKWAYSDVYEYN